MKTQKELYSAPQVESVNLMGIQPILAGSDNLNSNTEPLGILDDDFSNWNSIL